MSIELTLFGPFQLKAPHHPPVHFRTNKVRALLAYLAAEHGRHHSRHELATLLWPESSEQQARQNLSQAIHRLRKTCATISPELFDKVFIVERHTVCFMKQTEIICDVITWQEQLTTCFHQPPLTAAGCPTCLQKCQMMVRCYQGDFLAGFHVRDSSLFEDWLMFKREHYQQLVIHALDTLINSAYQQGKVDQVVRYAQRQLMIEPWNERSRQYLMLAFAQQGLRPQALAQFQICQTQLWQTLGVKPSQKTIELAQQIRQGELERVYNQFITEFRQAPSQYTQSFRA